MNTTSENKFGVRDKEIIIISDGKFKNLLRIYKIKPFAQYAPLEQLPQYMDLVGKVVLSPKTNMAEIDINGCSLDIKDEIRKEQIKETAKEVLKQYMRFDGYSYLSPMILPA